MCGQTTKVTYLTGERKRNQIRKTNFLNKFKFLKILKKIKFSKNLKFVFLVKCFSFVYSKKKIIFFNKVPQKKNPNINLK